MISSESRMREIRTSGLMSRDLKRGHGSRTEARSESDGQATGPYNWRASPRLYPCGRELRPILRKNLGAYGYLIDRGTADRILETAPDIPVPIDHMLFNMVDSEIARRVRPLQMMPAAIRHRPHELVGSDTARAENRKLKNLLGRKPWKANEAVRLYRKASWVGAVLFGSARFVQVPYKDRLAASKSD